MKNKRGGYTDIFLFMGMALTIVMFSVLFIYMGGEIRSKLHLELDNKTVDEHDPANYSKVIDQTIGQVTVAYSALRWIAIFIILGMVIAIFMGSYMVTTKPVFFVPYIFITLIAIIASVGVSQGYEMMMADETLASTFEGFIGSNFILLNMPIWVTVIGIVGGIIMFVRMKHVPYE